MKIEANVSLVLSCRIAFKNVLFHLGFNLPVTVTFPFI